MIQSFIKNDVICSYNVQEGKVIATVQINGVWVSNPTLEDFYADGWQDYTAPEVLQTYAELVEQYIRENGYPTYGAELAVLNNYAENPTEYADAYAAYIATRHSAKEWANEQPHRDE